MRNTRYSTRSLFSQAVSAGCEKKVVSRWCMGAVYKKELGLGHKRLNPREFVYGGVDETRTHDPHTASVVL